MNVAKKPLIGIGRRLKINGKRDIRSKYSEKRIVTSVMPVVIISNTILIKVRSSVLNATVSMSKKYNEDMEYGHICPACLSDMILLTNTI